MDEKQMIEVKGNILSREVMEEADAICFTSNGVVRTNGRLVMGAGVAKAFRDRFYNIDMEAGKMVKANGNICQVIKKTPYCSIVAFPTKNHWRNQSDLALMKQSAEQLMKLVEDNKWNTVYLPRPGCSNGGLDWFDVKPEMDQILNNKVRIITFGRR